ncbi:hypothetical protein Cri9333_0673 [Crinalium epipsammum PCC 9333]|uniref:ARC6 IMS domain-containing protein n=1 Tax=Crinalium epipsammum PCC 9333 TaxID=1173022 RepID=K9VVM5_9CYAN|nr:hypothetical protein [Crinalium epipsammum]AFZ11609.1 hypothetical protein Cri9333_0673 [Crinalium epipsammum PCC 9333]
MLVRQRLFKLSLLSGVALTSAVLSVTLTHRSALACGGSALDPGWGDCYIREQQQQYQQEIINENIRQQNRPEAVRESNEAIAEVQSIAATVSKRETADQLIAEAQNEKRAQTNLPFFCAPDEYKAFFEKFVWGKDEQGKDIRARYTADRISADTFRVDYIKAQYKYTGNETGTESEEVVQTFGSPAAYIFQHRNGCWRLTQKLRSVN